MYRQRHDPGTKGFFQGRCLPVLYSGEVQKKTGVGYFGRGGQKKYGPHTLFRAVVPLPLIPAIPALPTVTVAPARWHGTGVLIGLVLGVALDLVADLGVAREAAAAVPYRLAGNHQRRGPAVGACRRRKPRPVTAPATPLSPPRPPSHSAWRTGWHGRSHTAPQPVRLFRPIPPHSAGCRSIHPPFPLPTKTLAIVTSLMQARQSRSGEGGGLPRRGHPGR